MILRPLLRRRAAIQTVHLEVQRSQQPSPSNVLEDDTETSNVLDDYQNDSHGNGNKRMQWDLIAVGSGNYVDKLVDMTGSIIALSFYYISAE
ncbi:Hypothetical predicted protein [Scomber scombrus]|uniref:Uncharacterized protein n=1 Tax=Scomber scombrus TaxID=13677 RepID=A0AAV1Q7V1_SCOSC